MYLLSQLVDAFDTPSWMLILFVASPTLGCMIGCARPIGRLDRVKWAAVYYVALAIDFGAMALMGGESAGLAVIGMLLLFCGPIIGLVLMAVPGEHL